MNGDTYASRDGARQPSSRDHYVRMPADTYSRRSSPNDVQSRDDRRDRDRGDRGDRAGDRERPRRRSRSPAHRSSRREFDGDTYSSSRDYREREREDRYSGGRDRRGGGGRDWDRDRGSDRRDARRDDMPPRRDRDRDLMDDRRGGGRRDRGDREGGFGGGGARQRERSASPPKKPKEPTPDLTDFVPITKRKRILTQWDMKPQGYENVTAEQAKLSGMFPLPGAPRQQPMDASKLQAFMNQPASSATNAALSTTNARQSKRLFAMSLPATATDESTAAFFNLHLNGLNIAQGQDPCLSAQISSNRQFALLEFKTPEDATMALTLDGVSMEGAASNGEGNGQAAGLRIRRPKDYITPPKPAEAEEATSVISSSVPDSLFKIALTHIPGYIDDQQIQELLSAFGQLRSFVLVRNSGSEETRGVAFCEYVDAEQLTDLALNSLNGMELGDSTLKAARACVGAQQVGGEMSVNAMSMLAGTASAELEQGRVLCLLNMVTAEELLDNDEYEEIVEDVKEECAKYGAVEDIKVPRPSGGSRQSSGVGKIYVKYDTKDSAAKALRALAGRKFADRTVVVTYFGEENFDVNAW